MKFIDEVTITIKSGNGGNGSVSFRREKYIAKGGPNGGNGGNGASIFFYVDSKINTLIDYKFKPHFIGKNGENGKGNCCTGKSADDIYLPVPKGTIIFDSETSELITELTKEKQKVMIAKGGKGGAGNHTFKSSINRTPYQFVEGSKGEQFKLRLELQLMADVGLLGLPNAGKSSLVNKISNTKLKVADYPFTTLEPSLGMVNLDFNSNFVIADIPGIIEGASSGYGLGLRFLKHLLRNKLLLHIIDSYKIIDHTNNSFNFEPYDKIIKEIEKFNKFMLKKPCWIVFNKIDLLTNDCLKNLLNKFQQYYGENYKIYTISSFNSQGVDKLKNDIAKFLRDKEQTVLKSEILKEVHNTLENDRLQKLELKKINKQH